MLSFYVNSEKQNVYSIIPKFVFSDKIFSKQNIAQQSIHRQIFLQAQTTLQFGEISITRGTCKENISGYVHFQHSLYPFGNKSSFQ